MQHSNQYWMEYALSIAKKVEDEIPVCALIVKDNDLISCAVNKSEQLFDATAHAEVLAIREASEKLGNWRLNNCTLYTTLEPCAMCTGAIINSRISKVIFGAYDINAGACNSKINLFCELDVQDRFEVIGGVMEKETSQFLKDFFAVRRDRFKTCPY